MRITAENGVPFTVRIVREGERYGLNMCLAHDEADPLVEFYDARYDNERFDPGLGQFVSRYKAETLLGRGEMARKRESGEGINLNGNSDSWQMDGATLATVLAWVSERVAAEPSNGRKFG